MKGLLTKDFRILAGQKRYFTIIILIALIFFAAVSQRRSLWDIVPCSACFYSKHDLV